MAEKNANSLIGFDPLAWMNDESEIVDKDLLLSKAEQEKPSDAQAETEQVPSISEVEDSGIVLASVQNIQNVAELYSQLTGLLDHSDKIEIDASEIISIDTATLQLLIVLKQTAAKSQKEVLIDFPSEKFIEAAGLLGLSEMLEVDKAEAGFF